jgi:hypothetical protein
MQQAGICSNAALSPNRSVSHADKPCAGMQTLKLLAATALVGMVLLAFAG